MFLYYVYISSDRFMLGVVSILCQELASGQLPLNLLNYHIHL